MKERFVLFLEGEGRLYMYSEKFKRVYFKLKIVLNFGDWVIGIVFFVLYIFLYCLNNVLKWVFIIRIKLFNFDYSFYYKIFLYIFKILIFSL